MKNMLKKAFLASLLVALPICAQDTEVTTKTVKKTPTKQEMHKKVVKTKKATAHNSAVVKTKDEVVKKTPAQGRTSKTVEQVKKVKTAEVKTPITATKRTSAINTAVPVAATAAPLIAGQMASAGSLQARANHKTFKNNSVMYALEQHPQVSVFTERLKKHHELSKLSGKGEYTVFAPLNEALEGKHLTDKKLEEHIVHGNLDTTALQSYKGAIRTLGNGSITIHEKNGHLYANNAELVGHGIKTQNGQIHFVKSIVAE